MSERFLTNRVAFVTGGASGMGRAMALKLAEAGARVAIGSLCQSGKRHLEGELVHRPADAALSETRAALEAYDVHALAFNLDVTDHQSVAQVIEETQHTLGPIDILCNAAGITAEQTLSGHSEALFAKVMEVNLMGVFRTMRLCLPGMVQRKWGRIINIASTAASVGAPTSGAYCASKAAVVGLTRAAALEGAPHNVTCNTISPGWVQTTFGAHWMGQIAKDTGTAADTYIQDTAAQNPQKRLIQPNEIGALASYLCREEALGITMQDLTISAGSLW